MQSSLIFSNYTKNMDFLWSSASNRTENMSAYPTDSTTVAENSSITFLIPTIASYPNKTVQNDSRISSRNGLEIDNVEVILEIIWLSAIFAFGFLMNVATLFILMKHPKARSIASLFIMNIAIADLLQCCFVITVIYGIVMEEWLFGPTLCSVAHAWTSIPYFVSFWGHLNLAICRYCYQNIKSKMCKAMLNTKTVIICILCMWILQVGVHWVLIWRHSAPLDITFLSEYGMCGVMMTDTTYTGYIVATVTLTLNIFIPFVACLIVYFSVARAVRRQVVAFPSYLAQKMYAEVTKYTTLLFGIFCLCWLPEYLRMIFDVNGLSPIWFIRLCNSLIFFNSAINPYIYALRCSAIKKAFIKQFPKIATILRVVDAGQESSSSQGTITVPTLS